jgi:hypothetical protein
MKKMLKITDGIIQRSFIRRQSGLEIAADNPDSKLPHPQSSKASIKVRSS